MYLLWWRLILVKTHYGKNASFPSWLCYQIYNDDYENCIIYQLHQKVKLNQREIKVYSLYYPCNSSFILTGVLWWQSVSWNTRRNKHSIYIMYLFGSGNFQKKKKNRWKVDWHQVCIYWSRNTKSITKHGYMFQEDQNSLEIYRMLKNKIKK